MTKSVAVTPQPGRRVPAPRRRDIVSGRDREFLPAALEILETPPAPAPIALMLTLCALLAVAVVWSTIGQFDIHAVAQGKIETVGRSRTLQPLDNGKVLALHTANGAKVEAGELLIELDPSEAQADETATAEASKAGEAEILRRQTVIAAARAWPVRPLLPAQTIVWGANVPRDIAAREDAVLLADLMQLDGQLVNIDKQAAQKVATRERLNMSIAFQTQLITTLQDRVKVREDSIKLAVGTKINLFDAMESLDKSRSQLASDKGQLLETEAAIQQLGSEKVKSQSQFIADNTSKLADAERKLSDVRQQNAKARTKLERTRLYAPVSGTVQQMAVTTVGQVVTTGQQLLSVIPAGEPLQVEIYMSNSDIGFVRVGQEAVVKVDAFPFTRYGTLQGTVIRIAGDAIDEQDARRAQANALNMANGGTGSTSSPGAPQNFVFPVTVSLDKRAMEIDGTNVPLTPGMTVVAEVKTEKRRVIDYLFSPLQKLMSESLRER